MISNPMWGFTSLVNKYVYAENPKVCCSTIKGRLFSLEAQRAPVVSRRITDIIENTPGRLHSPEVGPLLRMYQLPAETLKEVLESPDFFRFTFVRDPYSRVLSAYLEKMTKRGAVYLSMEKSGFPETPDFPSFVKLLSQNRKALMHDKHWRPQHVNLEYESVNFDFIGKFENFESDFAHVWHKLPTSISLDIDVRPHQTHAAEKSSQHYDSETVELVTKIFSKDFKYFGYSTTPSFAF